MRITEKNTPILKYLKWKKSLYLHKGFTPSRREIFLPFYDDVKARNTEKMVKMTGRIAREWVKWGALFSRRIDIISNPFLEAIQNSNEKPWSVDILREFIDKPISGTLICNGFTICYYVKGVDDETYDASVMVLIGAHVVFVSIDGDHYVSEVSKRMFMGEDTKDRDLGTLMANYYSALPISFHIFKKHAEVEVVDAKPFKKVQIPKNDAGDDTLLVDSHLPVKYYDCSWFRTIVRTEGFSVRGHMRRQPYKNEDGEWDYKLIFIRPYQKHGYTRTAKKIIHERKNHDD